MRKNWSQVQEAITYMLDADGGTSHNGNGPHFITYNTVAKAEVGETVYIVYPVRQSITVLDPTLSHRAFHPFYPPDEGIRTQRSVYRTYVLCYRLPRGGGLPRPKPGCTGRSRIHDRWARHEWEGQ